MRSKFTRGVHDEEVVSVFTNNTKVPESLSCTYQPDGSRQWRYDGNITLTPPNSTDSFFIEDNTMLQARFSIDAYIPSMIIKPNATASTVAHYPLPTEMDGPMTESTYNPLWLQSGEAAKMVERLAARLTNSLRNDPRFGETVYGSGVFVTFIVVEWSFFAFPIVVLMLTLALLLATIIQTYKKDVWKTSDLTTLVHGLSEEAKLHLKDANTMQEVREKAKDMKVYLTPYNTGRRQLDVFTVKDTHEGSELAV
jgi:hypothetical protein